jgi:apolipoprotein N-acyltransferase
MMGKSYKTIMGMYFPSIISGCLLTAAFPNTGLFWLMFVALVPFMISVLSMSGKQGFLAGLAAGLSHYLTLLYWIVPTLKIYGGLHIILAVSALILLSIYLALYVGIFALLFKKIRTDSAFMPLWAAAVWVGLEFIRSYILTGFPWGALGYSQYLNLVFIQIADFSGVYGVSFLIVLFNATVSAAWIQLKRSHPDERNLFQKKGVFIGILLFLVLIVMSFAYGMLRMNDIDVLVQKEPRANIAVVQGNIRQDNKWDKAFKRHTIEKYGRLSSLSLAFHPDLIIWPETALPFYYDFDTEHTNMVDKIVKQSKTNFLIGSPSVVYEGKNEDFKIYNRVYMLNRFAIIKGLYDKTHLVPFGEYIPFGKYLKFWGKLTAQAGDFSSGKDTFEPLAFNENKTGVLICFEILFPSISSGFVRNGATLLTTVTNDAWFGKTSAPLQHFSVAVFRAVENRRTVARSANTGISGFIDPKGEVIEATGIFEDKVISQSVPLLKELTLYTIYGDVFAVICIVAICLVFMVKRIRKNA